MKVTDTNLIDYLRLYHTPFPIIYGYPLSDSDATKTKLEDEIIAIKNAKKSYNSEKNGMNFIYVKLFHYCEVFLDIFGGNVSNRWSAIDMLKVYQSEQALLNKYLDVYRETNSSISKTDKLYILVSKMFQSYKRLLTRYIGAYRELTKEKSTKKEEKSSILNDIIKLLANIPTTEENQPKGQIPLQDHNKFPLGL